MHWNTVSPLLKKVLQTVMSSPQFDPFRLVGGTSLSLQIGHRMSEDIDLFTSAEYGSIDFDSLDQFFRQNFQHVDTNEGLPVATGKSWYVGSTEKDSVKVDIYYTDAFIRPIDEAEGIRMASKEDIIAMKLETIGNKGRKKDFWDIHELHGDYTIAQMIELYLERYPYGHTGGNPCRAHKF